MFKESIKPLLSDYEFNLLPKIDNSKLFDEEARGGFINSLKVHEKIEQLKVQSSLTEFINNSISDLKSDLYEFVKYGNFEYIYIPMLRGLRPVGASNTDPYFERTSRDYFDNNIEVLNKENKTRKKIYTGQIFYSDIKSKLLGDRENRDKVRLLEKCLSENFFEGKEITLIPREDKDVLQIEIGANEGERLIYEVGDGVQSLIALLYPLFINIGNADKLVFVEEPELSLHPGMQRIFLEVLKSDYFQNFQFFFTTHSNHFLDMSFEPNSNISIYRFAKGSDNEFIINNLSDPCHNLLQELGIRNSSLFLSNCTIWVEGITDRMYLKKFMEVYANTHTSLQKYKEDLHYSFIEYAGSNITHWGFDDDSDKQKIKSLAINQNIFLIVDSDCDENGILQQSKKERFENLRNSLNDQFYVTKGKEMENCLSAKVLNSVLSKYGDSGISITESEYQNLNIGDFLDKELKGKKRRTGNYKAGNTISDKSGFCEKAISSINHIDDLSEESKMLCKKLFQFVEEMNNI